MYFKIHFTCSKHGLIFPYVIFSHEESVFSLFLNIHDHMTSRMFTGIHGEMKLHVFFKSSHITHINPTLKCEIYVIFPQRKSLFSVVKKQDLDFEKPQAWN